MACRSGPRPARLRYVVSGLRQLAATRDVALARPHDHGLVLDEVVDRDGALLDLRERGRARVLDEPCRAADGRRAVLPPRGRHAPPPSPHTLRGFGFFAAACALPQASASTSRSSVTAPGWVTLKI